MAKSVCKLNENSEACGKSFCNLHNHHLFFMSLDLYKLGIFEARFTSVASIHTNIFSSCSFPFDVLS